MKEYQHSIGKEKAIELADSCWWELCDDHEIVKFQLFTAEVCMPLSRFHEALEAVLERPVWKHELWVNFDGIVREFLGERDKPTMQEIIDLIPEEKRIIIKGE